MQGRVEHEMGQCRRLAIKIVPGGDFKRDDAVFICPAVPDFVLPAVIERKADSRQGCSVLVHLGKPDRAVPLGGFRGADGHACFKIAAVRIQHAGHDALLIPYVRLPEKELGGFHTVKAVGGDGEVPFAIVRGDLNGKPVAVLPRISGDAGAVRKIVGESVAAADARADGGAADEIFSAGIFGQGKRGLAEADTSGGGKADVLITGQLDEPQTPVEQLLKPVFPSNPVAVGIEIEVLGHPVAVVFRTPEADRIGRGIPGLLIGKAARRDRVAVFEDRIQADQGIPIVIVRAVDRVIAAVIRAVFARLQAVSHFAGFCDPVRGSGNVDPFPGGGKGLEIRIHGAGGHDGVVRKGRDRKCCAENEDHAEQYSGAPAHLFLAKGIIPPFFAVFGKKLRWHHLLSPADCPAR